MTLVAGGGFGRPADSDAGTARRRRLCGGVAFCALAAFGALAPAPDARAQSFVIQSGQTAGQQDMNNPFDTGLVEQGGTVTDTIPGVDMDNDDQTLTNRGTIISTGNDGVVSFDDRQTIINSGTITGDDKGLDLSDVTLFDNSGTVTGNGDDGFEASDVDVFRNTGILRGLGGDGVETRTVGTFFNSGTITGSDGGVENSITIDSFFNSGTITGGTGNGVESSSEVFSFTNTGTISGRNGVLVDNDVPEFFNSGTITGTTHSAFINHGNIDSFFNSGTLDGDGVGANFNNDIGTFFNSGTITGRTDHGVEAEDIVSFTNEGTITSGGEDGVRAETITVFSNTGTITGEGTGLNTDGIEDFFNSGTITGKTGRGANIDGPVTTFFNTGTIMSDSGALFIDGDVGLFENTGTLMSSSGGGANLDGTVTIFRNTGTITGEIGNGVDGRNFGSFSNSGTITGGDGAGVRVFDVTSFTNGGTITGSTDGVLGLAITTFLNSGTIIAGSTNAIWTTSIDTIILREGSNIQGPIRIDGGTTTLFTGPGLSGNLTFTGGTQVVGGTNGNPFVQTGSTIVVVDTANIGFEDEQLAEFVRGLSSVLRNRFAATNGNGSPEASAYAASPYLTGYFSNDGSGGGADVRDSSGVWSSTFGGVRHLFEDSDSTDANMGQGGIVFGVDGYAAGDMRFGIFGGAAFSFLDSGAQQTDTGSYFGGVYGQWTYGASRIDAVLTAGFSDNDLDRDVANNLVPGGIETASADYDGWFIVPEVTLTHPWEMAGQALEASATLRYAGLFLDGYTESGVATPMTVGDREVHQAMTRLQIARPQDIVQANGAVARVVGYAGVEARAQFGDDTVSGSLLGQTVTFESGGDDAVGGVFAGFRFEQVWSADMMLFGGMEFLLDTAGMQASADAGLRIRF